MGKEDIIDKKPSKSELYIMKVIWDAPGEITLQYVAEELKEKYDKEYARTTIATFLKRLEEKEYIHQEKRGRYTYITPIKSEKAFKEAYGMPQRGRGQVAGVPKERRQGMRDRAGHGARRCGYEEDHFHRVRAGRRCAAEG